MARIAALGVVSASNAPLFLRVSPSETEEPLRFHAMLHAALDAVEERLAAPRKAPGTAEPYLGLLGPAGEYLVYGYATCTRVKLLLVVDAVEAPEEALRETFRRLHALYCDAACNPWQAPGQPLLSRRFAAGAEALLA